MSEIEPSQLEQLIYVGSATHLLSEDELLEVLRQTRIKHEALGVSGLMVYSDGTFIQVLEGTPKILDTLYQQIEHDVRHRKCFVLLRQAILQRAFEGWSMGWRNTSEKDYREVAGYLDFFGDKPVPESGMAAYRLLNSFRKQHDRELDFAYA